MGNSNTRKSRNNIYPYKRNLVYPYNVRGNLRDRAPYSFKELVDANGNKVLRSYRCSIDGRNIRYSDQIIEASNIYC
jgi:hypothetical protein